MVIKRKESAESPSMYDNDQSQGINALSPAHNQTSRRNFLDDLG
jgi:hypothetical protein